MPLYIRNSLVLSDMWLNTFVRGVDNFVCVSGRKGKGKSISVGLNTGLALDPKFKHEMDKFVLTDIVEFAERIVDPKNKRRVIILDESGLSESASSMKWWEKDLQALRDILQVDRIRHQTKIMIGPRFKFVAKFARDLFNYIIDVEEKNVGTGYVLAKVYNYEIGQLDDKIYKKFLISHTSSDKAKKTMFWKPPQKYIDMYEQIINPHKNDIMQRRMDEMKRRKEAKELNTMAEQDSGGNPILLKQSKDEIRARFLLERTKMGAIRKNSKGEWNTADVALLCGVGFRTARGVVRSALAIERQEEALPRIPDM